MQNTVMNMFSRRRNRATATDDIEKPLPQAQSDRHAISAHEAELKVRQMIKDLSQEKKKRAQ